MNYIEMQNEINEKKSRRDRLIGTILTIGSVIAIVAVVKSNS